MSALAVTLTVDELEALVERAVRKATGATVCDDPIMTRAEVAKMLNIHEHVVTRYVRKQGLPGKTIGREWRFRRSEVLAWLDERKAGRP